MARHPRSNLFNSVAIQKPKRNLFDLSHNNLLTMDWQKLIPTCMIYTIPGDTIKLSLGHLVRFMPMKFPVMDDYYIAHRAFAVPIRLLYDDYEEFFTGGEDGKATPVFPTSPLTTPLAAGQDPDGFQKLYGTSSLADYLGIPTNMFYGEASQDSSGFMLGQNTRLNISKLPFRAYKLIWQTYFKNENIDYPAYIDADVDTGGSTSSVFTEEYANLLPVGWRKDYFFSALPFTQRGQDVTLPIGGFAPVALNPNGLPQANALVLRSTYGRQFAAPDTQVQGIQYAPNSSDRSVGVTLNRITSNEPDVTSSANRLRFPTAQEYESSGQIPHLAADLSNATSTTINELRRAIALQRWYELNARVGVRFPEYLLGHYGVRSSDARLQRPEYLGGLRSRVSIGEVLQTSQTTEDSPLGDYAGHGLSADGGFLFKHFSEEPEIILVLSYIMPKPSYMQGLSRFWTKNDKFDFADPMLANLGEQPVYNYELYMQPNPTIVNGINPNMEVFGYQSRYAEYKYMPNEIHGHMRRSLKSWHSALDFTAPPGLNQSFIYAKPSNRIFAVEDVNSPNAESGINDKFICRISFNIKAVRPLPFYGTPIL